jgi:hypothetical protein
MSELEPAIAQPQHKLGLGPSELNAGAPGGYSHVAGLGRLYDDELAIYLDVVSLGDAPGDSLDAYGHHPAQH